MCFFIQRPNFWILAIATISNFSYASYSRHVSGLATVAPIFVNILRQFLEVITEKLQSKFHQIIDHLQLCTLTSLGRSISAKNCALCNLIGNSTVFHYSTVFFIYMSVFPEKQAYVQKWMYRRALLFAFLFMLKMWCLLQFTDAAVNFENKFLKKKILYT